MNKILGFTMVGLAVLSVISAIFVSLFFLIGAVLCGVLSYFIYFGRAVVEFEYTYMDKELRVDRIYNQSKRKQVDVFDLNKAEIVAPATSYHLDNFKNRDVTVSDYSTGLEDTDELKTYIMYYEGKRKIVLSLNDKVVQAIRTGIPSKLKLS
ncbi:MAG: DUF6106 family protein [Lachnospiraceae bacterium]|nr:DUF6106 family protein [Lachnospiraceae bacterium]